MKTRRLIAVLIVAIVAQVSPAVVQAGDCNDRIPVINLHGSLSDDDGLPYDGPANMSVGFHDSDQLVYEESFEDVVVERGSFRLPLLQGAVIFGSPSAVLSDAAQEVYVDVSVDGVLVLDQYPMGAHLAAVRAEYADSAYAIKDGYKLTSDEIPAHSATKITSGTMSLERLPQIPIEKFTQGTLDYVQIPPIAPSKVTDGIFAEHLLPAVLDAELFTTGVLHDDVLPTDILIRDNIYVGTGTAGHMSVIPIPVGFTRDYCQWVVGIKQLDGSGGVDQFQVYTDADGVITCRWSPNQADAELNNYCMASYLVVCLK